MPDTTFSHADYARVLEDVFRNIRRDLPNTAEATFKEMAKLGTLKGGEYAHGDDRLDNFRRNGKNLDLPIEVIWTVYAAKHWDAVTQYVSDLNKGIKRDRLESITGRVDDLLVYLILFKCMVVERERE